jgi:chromosome segregation ATPase
MSPTDAEKLDSHDHRINHLETQTALDKQSRQQMHRAIDGMNNTVANLAVDFKEFMADYHDNKTALALAARNMENMAARLADLERTKADKMALDAVDTKIDTTSRGLADRIVVVDTKAEAVSANQTWATRGVIAALLGAIGALVKSFLGR